MRNVIISSTAQKHLDDIIFYLEKQWSFRSKDQFLEKLLNKIETVNEFPEIGKVYDIEKNTRSLVLFKQITLYYTFTQSELKILAFFDSRRRPNRIPKILQ